MNGIYRWCLWFICGIFLIAATGFLLLFKVWKGQSEPTYSDAPPPAKGAGRLQRFPVAKAESDLTEALQELFLRTGFDQEETRDQLARMGVLAVEPGGGSAPAREAIRKTGHSRPQDEFRKGLEEAVQEGLRWAQLEDDYSRAGVEYAEGELDQEFEAILFNPEARDRLDLCNKLLINLQEMLRRDEFPHARTQIEELIALLNNQAIQAEEELTCRTTVHESEVGARTDRQFYAFQAGVVQSLRGKRLFLEIDALYRSGTTKSALNYNDQDAFALLRQRCGVFAAIEQVGIQKLLQAGEEEIRAMVEEALPPPSQPGSVS